MQMAASLCPHLAFLHHMCMERRLWGVSFIRILKPLPGPHNSHYFINRLLSYRSLSPKAATLGFMPSKYQLYDYIQFITECCWVCLWKYNLLRQETEEGEEANSHRTQSFEMALNDEKKKVAANERSFGKLYSSLNWKSLELEVKIH